MKELMEKKQYLCPSMEILKVESTMLMIPPSDPFDPHLSPKQHIYSD